MFGQFGQVGGLGPQTMESMRNQNVQVDKPRLADVLGQATGALGELHKLMGEILVRLQGPLPQVAEKACPPQVTGTVGMAVEIRSQVHRLQDLAQAILNEL
jgi:hypothetical protein